MSEFNSIAGAATAFESWLSRKRGSFASDVIEMQADVCMMAVHELALNKSNPDFVVANTAANLAKLEAMLAPNAE